MENQDKVVSQKSRKNKIQKEGKTVSCKREALVKTLKSLLDLSIRSSLLILTKRAFNVRVEAKGRFPVG